MATANRSKAKKTSVVWRFFKENKEKNNATCVLCSKQMVYKGSSTSTLLKHLQGLHSEELRNATEGVKKTQSSLLDCGFKSVVAHTRPCSRERSLMLTTLISEMITHDLCPFSVVSNEGFRRLIHAIEPNYKLPSRQTIVRYTEKRYKDLLPQVTACLPKDGKFISLTTDLWTSRTTTSYVALTAHFITETWELKNFVLKAEHFEERHTAINIAACIQSAMELFEISENVFTTVHDNAANMNLAMELADQFPFHLQCAGHTLQLAIDDALDKVRPVRELIVRTKKLVAHFRHSTVSSDALKREQVSRGIARIRLKQCVATRWNSTYEMLEVMQFQQPAVMAVLYDKDVTKPSDRRSFQLKDEDWDLLEPLCNLLKPLAATTTWLSAEENTSVSIIAVAVSQVIKVHLNIKDTDIPGIKQFKKSVASGLTRRFQLDSSGSCMFRS